MKDPSPALELCSVTRTFARGTIPAVDGITLTVSPGEIVSILGPSGCGKTTTMRMIAGLDRPTAGDIRLFGESVLRKPPHRRNIGLVFQSLAVFPHMNVRQNVAFGLRMRRMSRAMIEEKVARILDLVQLQGEKFGERYPSQLSGGQLQRVALARTLVIEPALVLFDEPMAALDRRLRDYMAQELRAIQKRLDVAAVYVTHDQETASAMSDRIAIMQAGRIVQVGTPRDVYEHPSNRFVAGFLGDVNLVRPTSIGSRDGAFRSVNIAGATVQASDADQEDGGEAVVMFRPEHVEVRTRPANGAMLKATIVSSQFGAGLYRWQIRLPDDQVIVARATEGLVPEPSASGEVWISVKSSSARLLRR